MNIQKNSTLELLKLFASYMVVFIHVSFYGNVGIAVNALARFAVPFFFLVSGFYSYQIPCEKIKKRIGTILTLLVVATVCYSTFEIVTLLYWNMDGLVALLHRYTEVSTFINLLIFNMPVSSDLSSGHLWYLLAILYVYVIFYFLTKFRVQEKTVFSISFFLLFLHILLGEGLSLFGIVLPIQFVRNFALMGIPFFALGLLAKKYEDKFQAIPSYVIFISALVGIFESIFSRYYVGENELYIGSLFLLFAAICTFTKYADVQHPSFLTALEGCSTYIYIFHIILSSVIYMIYSVLGIDIYSSALLENLHPIGVCVCCTVFAYCLIKLLNQFHKAKAR